MSLITPLRCAVIIAGAAIAPVIATAPRGTDPGTTVSGLIDRASRSGLQGWELVDHATSLVHQSFDHYSAWHVWESPKQALAHGRGAAQHANVVLAWVLEGLGFDVALVHAARVRDGRNPWWHAGHVWVRATIADQQRDVCAMMATNRAGEVDFHPVTDVLPVQPWTIAGGTVGLVPFVVAQVWRQLLRGDDVPRWLYRRFGERV